MNFSSKKIPSDLLFKVVFHLVLWTVWIVLPLVNNADNEKFKAFSLAVIPVSLTNIPLFLINSEWLIPSVFRKKGMTAYLLNLLGLIAVFAILQNWMKEAIIPEELIRRHNDIFWAVVPVLFVTAISTGYGFI